MRSSFDSLCLFVFTCMCLASVLSAPTKKNSDDPNSPLTPSIQQQEKELEKLAKIAAQRLTHSIGVQKQKSFHYSNVNGKEKSEAHTEEKVVNPDTGDLVSDIKQDTNQDSGVPVMKTKIDIPAENIHKTFVDEGPKIATEQLEKTDYSDALQFTPIEVAKYLYQTGQFSELDQALKDLVNASIMTQKQAVEYKENVKAAYNQLVQSTLYSQTNELPLYNTPYESDNMLPPDVLPAYNYYNELLPYGNSDAQNVVPESDSGNGISELVNTLMDEWLTRTVLTGDRDAENMLSAIWDNVSQDENPDDLGQMRDILVDIFTTEIIEGLTSDVQQEMPYYSDDMSNTGSDKQSKVETPKIKQPEEEVKVKTEEKIKEEENKETKSKPEADLKHLKM